ncbi:ATPase, partial [Escherichia coli]|nr:ATPase [Escherichia coli]
LDPSSVSSNIHQHSVTETALVSSVPANQSTAGFTLDANVLARHESATDDVRKLLNSIFTEEEPEQPESAPASLTGEGGLDSAHSQLYRRLLEKEQWSRKEATELCSNW